MGLDGEGEGDEGDAGLDGGGGNGEGGGEGAGLDGAGGDGTSDAGAAGGGEGAGWLPGVGQTPEALNAFTTWAKWARRLSRPWTGPLPQGSGWLSVVGASQQPRLTTPEVKSMSVWSSRSAPLAIHSVSVRM